MTIEYRTATEEQKAVIEELLAAPFPATLETIAARLDLTPLAAAQILGRDMCSFVTGDVTERFDEVWASLAQWERATLFIQHGGHVFEIEAKLSAGKRAVRRIEKGLQRMPETPNCRKSLSLRASAHTGVAIRFWPPCVKGAVSVLR